MTARARLLVAAALLLAPEMLSAQRLPGRGAPPDSICVPRCRKARPLIAAAEGLGINIFLQRFNWWVRRAPWAEISTADWKRNIREGWEWDVDQFQTNQFGHPYGGGFYFNAGRDHGLSYWGSAPLVFLGSGIWEYFGENERPALNDLFTTSFGGMVFGEVGHRLGGIIRDDRTRGFGRVMRELAAFPFDPVGSVHRVTRGQILRVSADPDERDYSPLQVELQAGARLAIDSGPGRRSSWTGTLVADIGYGDAFAGPYTQPFDVFRVRLQVSPLRGGINLARMRGRLFGRELTDSTARMRHIFTVAQKSEYSSGPAYKFGGQSVEAGFVSDFGLTPHAHLQTEAYAEWLLLGAVDAPGAGVRQRAYDFGPGGGLSVAATLAISGQPVLSARWRFAYIHSISGSPADHQTHFVSLESSAPITKSLRVGGYAGWYHQRSIYDTGGGAQLGFPEFRAYLVWRGGRGPVPRETAGGSGL